MRPRVFGSIPGMVFVLLLIAVRVEATDQVTLQKRLEPYYRISRPDGAGTFPAAMMVSGCSGFSPKESPTHYTRIAERLKGQGFVVIFVDYLSARGFSTCRDRGGVRGLVAEIAQDLLATAAYLRTLPFVKPLDIVAMGWSMGGGGVLAALGAVSPSDPPPFRAAVTFYPFCPEVQPWQAPIPALLLMGALDDISRLDVCQSVVKKLPSGTPVEVRIYPEARHGFDASDLPPMLKWGASGTVGYNAAAAAAAWDEVQKFLGR